MGGNGTINAQYEMKKKAKTNRFLVQKVNMTLNVYRLKNVEEFAYWAAEHLVGVSKEM